MRRGWISARWPEWELDSGASGAPRISGYIYHDYGLLAGRVQVLVEALDPSEQVVAKRYQRVAADHYRVSVPYYTYEDAPGGGIFGTRF